MSTEFAVGDVLQSLTRPTDYIRVGHPHASWPDVPKVFVMDCDEHGHVIGLAGRYLLALTLTTRYQTHSSPRETYR